MSSTSRKVRIASIALLAIGVGAVSLSSSASAGFRHGGGGFGGGFHHGFGGFGGGFHHRFGGGGFGLGLGALGVAGGYGYYDANYPYDDGYGANPGCGTYQPVYDQYGNYLGRSYVDACQ